MVPIHPYESLIDGGLGTSLDYDVIEPFDITSDISSRFRWWSEDYWLADSRLALLAIFPGGEGVLCYFDVWLAEDFLDLFERSLICEGDEGLDVLGPFGPSL